MHYELNVSLNGHHFFATHERSVQDEGKLQRVWFELRTRFPAKDGFEVTCTKWQSFGETVTPASFVSRTDRLVKEYELLADELEREVSVLPNSDMALRHGIRKMKARLAGVPNGEARLKIVKEHMKALVRK